jgi:hypothetical protein
MQVADSYRETVNRGDCSLTAGASQLIISHFLTWTLYKTSMPVATGTMGHEYRLFSEESPADMRRSKKAGR